MISLYLEKGSGRRGVWEQWNKVKFWVQAGGLCYAGGHFPDYFSLFCFLSLSDPLSLSLSPLLSLAFSLSLCMHVHVRFHVCEYGCVHSTVYA